MKENRPLYLNPEFVGAILGIVIATHPINLNQQVKNIENSVGNIIQDVKNLPDEIKNLPEETREFIESITNKLP